MLKTVMLLHIFVETGFIHEQSKKKNIFDQFIASLLNESINFSLTPVIER